MNYDELSNFEINKLVAESLGLDAIGQSERENNSSIWLYDLQAYVDYCNNPNDAWPIIASSKIDLEWNKKDCCAARYYTILEDLHNKKDIHYHNKNPLRAAMIVFLMMKEEK